jgi:hypothetical protein
MQQITVFIDLQDQLNKFRPIFTHLHELKTANYSMPYGVQQRRIYSSYVVLIWFVCSFVCLFSWRYNTLWLYFHSPVAGFSFFVFEVS